MEEVDRSGALEGAVRELGGDKEGKMHIISCGKPKKNLVSNTKMICYKLINVGGHFILAVLEISH